MFPTLPRLWKNLHASPLCRRLDTAPPEMGEPQTPSVVVQSCLSVANEQRCRQEMAQFMERYSKKKAQAAVLVSLCLDRGEPAFLFTLRSSHLRGRHKGDVSFAGGKCDSEDRGVIHTALREVKEELGIEVKEANVWGVLRPLSDWVEDIFTIPLSHACVEHNQGYTHFRIAGRYGYTLPVFLNAKHRVWGLTAIATDAALSLLLPGLYRSKVYLRHTR
ncbi:nucleoside diphosphate-linked moiety X motif 8 isoform X2 [Latimeria chalumnae]|uniref:nucleoside diphosphate-linked moiety X motif 8 isoform X2 n=1 Tax=Latimeria chalumnae TaxID=7897 RepID=UPI00313D3339